MMRGWFITGTDTDVGKTWIAAGLMTALRRQGLRSLALKPVACGCFDDGAGLRNGDALLLRAASCAPEIDYTRVNRYAFADPVSPHIAAARAGATIDLDLIAGDLAAAAAKADCVIVEGAGGWDAPLGPNQTIADLARVCALPVLLVVGLRLGCLNHALLSSRAISASGLPFAGWIANLVDPAMDARDENIETLRQRLPAPLIGCVPHLPAFDAERIADHLAIDRLSPAARK